jgi:hypothetical protein
LLLAATSATPNIAHAENLDAQQKAIDLITNTADRICNVVSQKGEASGSEVGAKVNAELKGLASHLLVAGVSAEGSHKDDQYQGVLREHLADTLKDNTACRLKVFEDLKDKFLGSGSESSSPRSNNAELLGSKSSPRSTLSVHQVPWFLPNLTSPAPGVTWLIPLTQGD